jgi:beta-galactosidase
MDYDLLRSVKHGSPWLMTEGATSAVNWRPVNRPKSPGQMRLWSYQALARGADGIMFFQWRQARASAEQFHSAMVPHGGTQSRTWRDVVTLGHELASLGEIAGARTHADVAIGLDWDSAWALELEGKPSSKLRYIEQLRAYYRALHGLNYAIDYVEPAGDLSPYRVLVLPNLYAVSLDVAARLTEFVAAGGTLVVGPFSGIADPSHRIHEGPYPGAFRDLFGLWIDDFWPEPDGVTFPVEIDGAGTHRGHTWRDWIELVDAQPIATFSDGATVGRAAATMRTVGEGTVIYIGTCLNETGLGALIERALRQAGVAPLGIVPVGVELARRSTDRASYLFILNHLDRPVEFPLEGIAGTDLLTQQPISETVRLGARDVAVIRENPSQAIPQPTGDKK